MSSFVAELTRDRDLLGGHPRPPADRSESGWVGIVRSCSSRRLQFRNWTFSPDSATSKIGKTRATKIMFVSIQGTIFAKYSQAPSLAGFGDSTYQMNPNETILNPDF